MATINVLDSCSVCSMVTSKTKLTLMNDPSCPPCDHKICFQCLQKQWLLSDQNDSETIQCLRCTTRPSINNSDSSFQQKGDARENTNKCVLFVPKKDLTDAETDGTKYPNIVIKFGKGKDTSTRSEKELIALKALERTLRSCASFLGAGRPTDVKSEINSTTKTVSSLSCETECNSATTVSSAPSREGLPSDKQTEDICFPSSHTLTSADDANSPLKGMPKKIENSRLDTPKQTPSVDEGNVRQHKPDSCNHDEFTNHDVKKVSTDHCEELSENAVDEVKTDFTEDKTETYDDIYGATPSPAYSSPMSISQEFWSDMLDDETRGELETCGSSMHSQPSDTDTVLYSLDSNIKKCDVILLDEETRAEQETCVSPIHSQSSKTDTVQSSSDSNINTCDETLCNDDRKGELETFGSPIHSQPSDTDTVQYSSDSNIQNRDVILSDEERRAEHSQPSDTDTVQYSSDPNINTRDVTLLELTEIETCGSPIHSQPSDTDTVQYSSDPNINTSDVTLLELVEIETCGLPIHSQPSDTDTILYYSDSNIDNRDTTLDSNSQINKEQQQSLVPDGDCAQADDSLYMSCGEDPDQRTCDVTLDTNCFKTRCSHCHYTGYGLDNFQSNDISHCLIRTCVYTLNDVDEYPKGILDTQKNGLFSRADETTSEERRCEECRAYVNCNEISKLTATCSVLANQATKKLNSVVQNKQRKESSYLGLLSNVLSILLQQANIATGMLHEAVNEKHAIAVNCDCLQKNQTVKPKENESVNTEPSMKVANTPHCQDGIEDPVPEETKPQQNVQAFQKKQCENAADQIETIVTDTLEESGSKNVGSPTKRAKIQGLSKGLPIDIQAQSGSQNDSSPTKRTKSHVLTHGLHTDTSIQEHHESQNVASLTKRGKIEGLSLGLHIDIQEPSGSQIVSSPTKRAKIQDLSQGLHIDIQEPSGSQNVSSPTKRTKIQGLSEGLHIDIQEPSGGQNVSSPTKRAKIQGLSQGLHIDIQQPSGSQNVSSPTKRSKIQGLSESLYIDIQEPSGSQNVSSPTKRTKIQGLSQGLHIDIQQPSGSQNVSSPTKRAKIQGLNESLHIDIQGQSVSQNVSSPKKRAKIQSFGQDLHVNRELKIARQKGKHISSTPKEKSQTGKKISDMNNKKKTTNRHKIEPANLSENVGKSAILKPECDSCNEGQTVLTESGVMSDGSNVLIDCMLKEQRDVTDVNDEEGTKLAEVAENSIIESSSVKDSACRKRLSMVGCVTRSRRVSIEMDQGTTLADDCKANTEKSANKVDEKQLNNLTSKCTEETMKTVRTESASDTDNERLSGAHVNQSASSKEARTNGAKPLVDKTIPKIRCDRYPSKRNSTNKIISTETCSDNKRPYTEDAEVLRLKFREVIIELNKLFEQKAEIDNISVNDREEIHSASSTQKNSQSGMMNPVVVLQRLKHSSISTESVSTSSSKTTTELESQQDGGPEKDMPGETESRGFECSEQIKRSMAINSNHTQHQDKQDHRPQTSDEDTGTDTGPGRHCNAGEIAGNPQMVKQIVDRLRQTFSPRSKQVLVNNDEGTQVCEKDFEMMQNDRRPRHHTRSSSSTNKTGAEDPNTFPAPKGKRNLETVYGVQNVATIAPQSPSKYRKLADRRDQSTNHQQPPSNLPHNREMFGCAISTRSSVIKNTATSATPGKKHSNNKVNDARTEQSRYHKNCATPVKSVPMTPKSHSKDRHRPSSKSRDSQKNTSHSLDSLKNSRKSKDFPKSSSSTSHDPKKCTNKFLDSKKSSSRSHDSQKSTPSTSRDVSKNSNKSHVSQKSSSRSHGSQKCTSTSRSHDSQKSKPSTSRDYFESTDKSQKSSSKPNNSQKNTKPLTKPCKSIEVIINSNGKSRDVSIQVVPSSREHIHSSSKQPHHKSHEKEHKSREKEHKSREKEHKSHEKDHNSHAKEHKSREKEERKSIGKEHISNDPTREKDHVSNGNDKIEGPKENEIQSKSTNQEAVCHNMGRPTTNELNAFNGTDDEVKETAGKNSWDIFVCMQLDSSSSEEELPPCDYTSVPQKDKGATDQIVFLTDELPPLAFPTRRRFRRTKKLRCERQDLKPFVTQTINNLDFEPNDKSEHQMVPNVSLENQRLDPNKHWEVRTPPINDDSNNGTKTEKSTGGTLPRQHRRRHRLVDYSSSDEHIPPARKRGLQYLQECMKVLEKVYNHDISDPFRHEIKSKDIPDYYVTVKRGMCFDIIGYKLRNNIYEDLHEFIADIQLVFDNCRLYYQNKNSKYCEAADIVEKYFEKTFLDVFSERIETIQHQRKQGYTNLVVQPLENKDFL